MRCIVKRASIALFALLAAGYADTLTLRDGTTVTGSWLGADGDRISFLVGNSAVKYARANVSQVTFGDDAAVDAMPSHAKPPSVAPPTRDPLPPPVRTPQPPIATPPPVSQPVPVATGANKMRPLEVVHYWDPAGPIVPVERASVVKVAAGAGEPASWEIKGAKSPFRVKRNPAMLFIVRLPEGVDANKIRLYRLSGGAVRRPYSTPGSNPYRTAPLSITNAGDSIGLAPVGELTDGEYAFIRTGSSDAYCFGVDSK
jgi:hypothetical protein